jgi:hypothetical protein
MRYKTENETMNNGGKQSRVSTNSPILQRINTKKKNKCNAKKKLHRRWREFGHQKAKNKRKTKIGCEEQQEQQETAANRYPPVIIPGIISIRHTLLGCFTKSMPI